MGFLLFVFVPAVIFTWLEDWNYLQAVYYAFITLSTIGFGDFTAGGENANYGRFTRLAAILTINGACRLGMLRKKQAANYSYSDPEVDQERSLRALPVVKIPGTTLVIGWMEEWVVKKENLIWTSPVLI